MRATRLAVVFMIPMALATGQIQGGLIVGTGNPLMAIPDGTQITFESAALGTFGSYSENGVSIRGVMGGPLRVQTMYSGQFNMTGKYLDNNGGSTRGFEFSFDELVNSFAFNFGVSDVFWQLTAYTHAGNVIEAYNLSPTRTSNSGNYFGIQADDIFRVTLSHNGGDFVLLDNVTFSQQSTQPSVSAVPEPASIVLFGLGSLGMGVIARRKKNKQNRIGKSPSQSADFSATIPRVSVG